MERKISAGLGSERARARLLRMRFYQQKANGKSKNTSKACTPRKKSRATLVTRFRGEPSRSTAVSVVLVASGLLLLVLLVYFWFS